MQAQAFLERHRPRLMRLAERASPTLIGDVGVEVFLKSVHEAFDQVEDRPGKREALPGEDVFWWCVTILEDISELPSDAGVSDPHVASMLSQLRDLAPRLEQLAPLPSDYRLYWFDELE